MSDGVPLVLPAPRSRLAAGGVGRYVAPLGCLIVAATIAVGIIARAGGENLGAPLAPFFVSWAPQVGLLAPLAFCALAGAVFVAPRLLSRRVPPTVFAALVALLTAVLTLLVSASRENGTAAWWSVFGSDPEASNEYLPALPAVAAHGVTNFLDRFAELAPTLPLHASAHPPGLPVLMHVAGLRTPGALAALVIVAGSLTAPLTYLLARRLLDEDRARVAALLWCLSPAALLYVATSADALFAALGAACALALLARRAVAQTLAPAAVALASFFSYSLLAAAAWAVLVLAFRDGLRRAVAIAAVCAGGLLLFYGALYATTGFDPFGAIASAHDAYTLGIARVRPYAFWLFGSPAAFLVVCGLPVMWFALRSLGSAQPAALALAGIVAVAMLLGLTKAETERIWLFMVPFACVAAAGCMPARALRPALGIMAAQTLAAQLLTFTVW